LSSILFVVKNKFDVPTPITDSWKTSYASKKNEKKKSVFYRPPNNENDNYFFWKVGIFFVGYYDFLEKIKQKLLFIK
jgi:hypothetical protein